jgi:hypothetical protein
MYPVLSFTFFVFSPKIQEHKQVALPISVHKHLSCAAFNITLATGGGTAGTSEKLHNRSRIIFRQNDGVCASGLTLQQKRKATSNTRLPAVGTFQYAY